MLPLPAALLNPINLQYCADDAPVALSGSPVGGVFSGAGVSGGNFDPATAGVGTHNIIYTVTAACGTVADTISVQVLPLPVAVINPTSTQFCLNDAPVALSGVPTGGVFSGAGVSSGSFDPAVAGTGSHDIIYTVTDACGTARDTISVQVLPLPVATIASMATQFCLNDAPVALSGAPTGGVFSGAGVNGSSFDPATAGAGTHEIIYTVTDACGTARDTISVVVLPAPSVDFVAIAPTHCVNGLTVTLQGIPSGGVFSGTGVAGGVFNPAQAGVGVHTLVYTLSDPCGMVADSQTVTVLPLPTANLTPIAPKHCLNSQPIALQGNPAGGVFSGQGVMGNLFYPSIAGAGAHTIVYTVTGTCSSATDAQTVSVLPVVTSAIAPMPTQFCVDSDPVALSGIPAGGTFSGDGVVGNSFNPALAGMGQFQLAYTIADTCGNSSAFVDVSVGTAIAGFSGLLSQYCLGAVDSVPIVPSVAGGQFYLNGNPINVPLAMPQTAGSYTLSYVISAGSCRDSISRTFGVEDFTISTSPDVSVCAGQPTLLIAQASAFGATYQWSPAAGLDAPTSATPVATVSTPTTYTVTATSPSGCTASAQISVGILGAFVTPNFTLTPDSGEAPLTVAFDAQVPAGTPLEWQFSDGRGPFLTQAIAPQVFTEAGTVLVSLITSPGTPCADTLTRTLYIFDQASYLFVPNVFTPNGDGIHDSFQLQTTGIQSLSVQLFDRWGLEVYRSDSPAFRWDGTTNGQVCPDGVYFYTLRYILNSGKSMERTGAVTLLR